MKRNLLLLSSFLVLGLLTSGLPAFGQGVQFTPGAGSRNVRAEGHTEIVSEVTLSVSIPGDIVALSTIKITYSSTITNAPDVNNVKLNGAAPPGTVGVVVSGRTLTISNTALWSFVAGDTLSVSGVRVDVAGAGAISEIKAALSAFSTAPATNPVTFLTPSVTVATVMSPATEVDITATKRGVLTCAPASSAANSLYTFVIEVKEKEVSMFTTLDQEIKASGGPLPGIATPPVPTDPTKVLVNIAGVPSGLTISFDSYDATQSATLKSSTAASTKTSTGKTITFTFPVTASDLSQIEKFVLNFSVYKKSADTLDLGPATVTASVQLGPIDDVDPDAPSDTPSLLFADVEQGSADVFGVSDCVTNLLFPWVVVDAPGGTYDTGIAIANTSKDEYAVGAALAQSGSCALTGFKMEDGSAVAMTPTLGPIDGGATGTVVLSTHSEFVGFRGYVIAVCQFQNAHAFAYITDEFAGNRTSQGYLALVIPNPGVSARSPAGGGSGEALNQ
jgi:hypothetical protein